MRSIGFLNGMLGVDRCELEVEIGYVVAVVLVKEGLLFLIVEHGVTLECLMRWEEEKTR
jgi:hypothetical protein